MNRLPKNTTSFATSHVHLQREDNLITGQLSSSTDKYVYTENQWFLLGPRKNVLIESTHIIGQLEGALVAWMAKDAEISAFKDVIEEKNRQDFIMGILQIVCVVLVFFLLLTGGASYYFYTTRGFELTKVVIDQYKFDALNKWESFPAQVIIAKYHMNLPRVAHLFPEAEILIIGPGTNCFDLSLLPPKLHTIIFPSTYGNCAYSKNSINRRVKTIYIPEAMYLHNECAAIDAALKNFLALSGNIDYCTNTSTYSDPSAPLLDKGLVYLASGANVEEYNFDDVAILGLISKLEKIQRA